MRLKLHSFFFFCAGSLSSFPQQNVLRVPCAEFQNYCGGFGMSLQAHVSEHNTHMCTKANALCCTCGPNLARFLNAF